MIVKYKKLTNVKSPMHGTAHAACYDLSLPVEVIVRQHCARTIDLGIAFDIPKGWCMYLQPRSSTFTNHGLLIPTGIIDADYKGPVHAQIYNMNGATIRIAAGTRLVQVQLFQTQLLEFEECVELGETDRLDFIGSTGA
jgi:dUTP pyrophosphatase